MSQILDLSDLLQSTDTLPSSEWNLKGVRSDQCMSFVAWNSRTKEALIVDPKVEDLAAYRELAARLQGYQWLGVIDTHTHADHISCGSVLALEIGAPLVMYEKCPCSRVSKRVADHTRMETKGEPLLFIFTPGHTQDSMVATWGPFLFGGDTVVIGDTGRDDLPGGSAEEHHTSLVKLKSLVKPEMILLAGHGRQRWASTWARELKENTSLNQSREDFVRDSIAFKAPPPALLEKALRENSK